MDLTTRCPKCHTEFQASLADLQLRKGYIRCVQCANIFDGYAEVVSENNNPTDAYAAILSEPVFDSYSLADDSPNEPEFIVSNTSRQPARHSISTAADIDPGDDFSIGSIAIDDNDRPAQADSFIVEPDPYRQGPGTSASLVNPKNNAIFGVVAWFAFVALLLLLLLQAVYVYRLQLAQNFPGLRPVLERYCSYLSCEVPYARDLDNLVITKSALKIIKQEISDPTAAHGDTDGPQPKKYELQFNLRNLANIDQQWPTVVLNLKDNAGQIQVRRNLSPSDYLRNSSPALSAQQEIFIRLPIELKGDININGFQLDLFFP